MVRGEESREGRGWKDGERGKGRGWKDGERGGGREGEREKGW